MTGLCMCVKVFDPGAPRQKIQKTKQTPAAADFVMNLKLDTLVVGNTN